MLCGQNEGGNVFLRENERYCCKNFTIIKVNGRCPISGR